MDQIDQHVPATRTYVLTAFDPAEAPLRLEAETHAVEGASHVFRRTAFVMGRPRLVVVRRIEAARVARVDCEG